MNKIYIFGHKNPDTDSICSTIAYENLKKQLGYDNYIAARLGAINKETTFALNYFNVDKPMLLKGLNPQVSDLNLPTTVVAHETDTVKQTLEKIISKIGRSIPVVDENERLIGIVSISDIVPPYLEMTSKTVLKDLNTPFKNLMIELKAEILMGKYQHNNIMGNVYLASDLTGDIELTQDDIVIADRKTDIIKEYETNGCCMILGNYNENDVINGGDSYEGVILTTKYSVYEIVKLIGYSVPIKTMVKKEALEYFVTYETIDDVKNNMLTSRHRRFPVVDEFGFIKGMISRSNLIDINRKKVILMDHNEKSQSIEGIEETEIVEVVDHHRVANVQTMAPLYFRIEPLGCTCTIVAKMYEENNITITKEMAGIMLSAIISDTLLFKSPTSTKEDRRIGRLLSKIAGVDLHKYGMKLITAGSSLREETPENIINNDMKKFMFGKYKVMISQINTGDFAGFYTIFNDITSEMNKICDVDNIDLVVLMITDIVVGGTEILAIGKERWIAENAFNMDKEDISIFLPNVFSRKKQIVPMLMNAAKL
ncbi:putative manganese-dependent inorganic diphosphatase [Vallitalea sp.]|jgi:manganese-dependent inorganic pyrophosphatase|uniref:putative manganese-dependent inorganic diphosphatase n=1 Tax=Vallitalea sp. TaxID=1882829 RepID=UPI0025F0BF3B|nr:putative manganese-dependent inorganic diphosphatase [Vallitalea sp.]MCT4688538.1 putative manganese-dependent inorganic diphosphatase [Vallitalea sp.]